MRSDVNDTRAFDTTEPLPLGERLLRLYHAPRRVFAAIRDGGNWPDWILPVLLVAGVWAAHNAVTMSVVAPEDPAMLPTWEQMSEEERTQATDWLAEWRRHGWASMPVVGSLSSLAVVALVLLGISKWVLRADLNLRQTLALKAYGSLVAIPQWILLTPLVRSGGTASARSFTPGALLSEEAAATLVGRFLSSLNVFDVWQAAVIGIGLAVMSGQPARRTTSVLLVMWLAWMALGALLPPPPPPTA